MVLIPEVAIRLVAEDLGILADDPLAEETVQQSHAYLMYFTSEEGANGICLETMATLTFHCRACGLLKAVACPI